MLLKKISLPRVFCILFGLVMSLQTQSVSAEMKIYGNGLDFPQTPGLKELGIVVGVHTVEKDTGSIYLVFAEAESLAAAACNAFASVVLVLAQDGIKEESFPIRTPETPLFQRSDPLPGAKMRMTSERMIAGFAVRTYDEYVDNIEQQSNAVVENSISKSIFEIYKGQQYLICETRLDIFETSDTATGLTTGMIEEKTTVYKNTASDGGSIDPLLPSSGQHCDYSVVEYGYWPEYQVFSTLHKFTCKK